MISGWPSAAGRPVILPRFLNVSWFEHWTSLGCIQFPRTPVASDLMLMQLTQRKILKLLQVISTYFKKKLGNGWASFLGRSFFFVIFLWKEEIEFKIQNWETLFMSGDSVIPEDLRSMVGRSRQTNQIWSCAFHRPLLPQFPAKKCLRFTSNLS